MTKREIVTKIWDAIGKQNPEELRVHFDKAVTINWHDSNESFNLDEFIIANCEYPGSWFTKIQRIDIFDYLVITVTHVGLTDKSMTFHAVSFFEFENNKVILLNEYWGTEDTPPQWRIDKQIGRPIV